MGASGGRALIVEAGDTRGALAAVRALGRAGWAVGVATPSGAGIASSSRYARVRHRVPGPSEGRQAFLSAVEAAVDEGRYEVVMAGGDAEVTAISAGRERLGATVPHPPHETVLRALDKLELAEAGRAAGWQVPVTERAMPGLAPSWTGPTVVKARLHSPHPDGDGPARIEGGLAQDGAEAAALADRIRGAGGEPLFQAHCRGRLAAVGAVCAEGGELVACSAQVAEATTAGALGVSVRARSVTVDPQLREACEALLTELGWFGIAQIQYLLDEDGTGRLIDFNPRLYGSLQLAVGAGANLPVAWGALATGRPLPADLQGRAGVGLSWLQGGLVRAKHAPRGRVAAELFSALRPRRATVGPIWQAADPAPALANLSMVVRQATRSRAGGRA